MDRHEDILQQITRIARASRDFFVAVCPTVSDAEVRAGFTYISDVKGQLLSDLGPWLPQGMADSAPDSTDHISPAAVVEKLYADARKAFRGNAPAAGAKPLSVAEEQLLRLLERAFESTDAPALKELLKSYYPQLVICREAMRRLRTRQVA